MNDANLTAIAAEVRAGNLVLSHHAPVLRMAARAISVEAVTAALIDPRAAVIEDYPVGDARGASCLMRSWVETRVLHLVVSIPPLPVLITVYWPDERPHEWDDAYRRRR